MSTAINKVPINNSKDFDEETWLVEPPNLPSQSNAVQGSGRIIEWLQGAAMNVDFQTRSALSRKLASQAAKKKKRAEKLLEKSKTNGHSPTHLARVQEELAELSLSCNDDNDDEQTINHRAVDTKNKELKNNHMENPNESKEQQQQQQEFGIGKSELLQQHEDRTVVLVDNNGDDDDENDEFYDASSEFNDSPRKLTPASVTNSTKASTASMNEGNEKIVLNGSPLSVVSECTEFSSDNKPNDVSLPSTKSLCHDTQYIRQANTARVPPTVVQNLTERSPRMEKLSAKSHSPSAQPDLNDIRNIVERQETELREELSRLKCNAHSENGKTPQRARVTSQLQSERIPAALASSRSVEFGTKLSPLATPSPVSHVSRLPTPIRRSVAGRSMIPVPRTSLLTRSAVRGLAGGSTPSLAVPSLHTSDETRSECGALSRNDQRWTDECF